MEGLPAWSEGHLLSQAANHIIAGMVRKVGGFTLRELNLTMEDVRDTAEVGTDLGLAQNGIACTTASLIAADVATLIATGDTRWIERGAHGLLSVVPDATYRPPASPRAHSLHGALAEQLEETNSFTSGLRQILDGRHAHGIATTQVDIPQVAHPGMLVLVHRHDGGARNEAAPLELTVLNFTPESLCSHHLMARSAVTDAESGETVNRVDDLRSFPLTLGPYEGRFLLFGEPEPEDPHPANRAMPMITSTS